MRDVTVEKEPQRTPRAKATITKSAPETVSIRNLWPSKVIVPAEKTKSGKTYVFEKAGSIVSVDKQDAQILLSLTRSRSCCGGVNEERRFFEKLGG